MCGACGGAGRGGWVVAYYGACCARAGAGVLLCTAQAGVLWWVGVGGRGAWSLASWRELELPQWSWPCCTLVGHVSRQGKA